MGRTPLLSLAAGALSACVALSTGTLAGEAGSPSPFPIRMVKMGGPPGDPATRQHLEFSASIGFDSVWVYAPHAGRWTEAAAPDGPFLHPEFLDLVRWTRERGMRVFVSINPVAESHGRFVFSDRDGERRIRKFIRMLRRGAGVQDFVLSFDDQPTRLTDPQDSLRYGASAAPAHLDLARRIEKRIRKKESFWLCAAAYADSHLGDGTGLYARPLLREIGSLSPRVGIVWTGPRVVSPSISGAALAATRARLGGRRLLLADNYPVNGNHARDALALVLGPLRERGPGIADQVDGYLACPMKELGASRLPLLTIADYLADPHGYDPDESWGRAMRRLVGDDPKALDALKTQGLEWGGWVGTRNYVPRARDNVQTALESIRDEAGHPRWTYVVRRYPERIAAMETIADRPFREELLARMAAKLAVGQTIPILREYRARIRAGRDDVEPLLDSMRAIGAKLDPRPSARRLYDLFLEEAGVPL